MNRSRSIIVVGVIALALLATACGSSKSSSSATSSPTTVAAKQGGDLVVAAEQEPDCVDWIGNCAGASWGVWSMQGLTMPRAYEYTDKGEYQPSILLTGPADVVTSPKQVVTYHINPKAVWSDGQPITSTDFWYTWDQVAHGTKIYDQTGYSQIESVDHTDPHTAVVTFSSPFADWKQMFGAFYGVLPSHILQGKDRDALMKDGYQFSGGPWMIDHWTKTVEVKLVPNPNYWGKKPNLNSITFKFITDTAAEQQAVRSGQVLGAYPQAQPGQEALKGTSGIDFNAITGINYEALWFNTEKAPLNNKVVRQALAYATDRNAIVQQLFAPIQPDIKPIQSLMTPAYGDLYTTPFAQYTLDLAKVTSLMTGDGWTKGSDGIWAKGGQRASLTLKTTTGNKRRLLTAQIVQSQWKAAGFELNLTTEKAGVLFGQDLPAGNFQLALYAQTPSDTDPSNTGCVIWCSKNIPSAANGGNGNNFVRINDPNLDKIYTQIDTSLDQTQRVTLAHQGQDALAQILPALPLDPFPDIVVLNSDKVGSETGSFRHNLVFGPFYYSNEWFLK